MSGPTAADSFIVMRARGLPRLTPREKWKFEHWRRRYQRRYGRSPVAAGEIGSFGGVVFVKRGGPRGA